jgi:alkylhydroperoxidase family enzyme
MSASATRLRQAVVARVLDGQGRTGTAARHAAFDNHGVPEPLRALVDKVAHNAWKVTDDDVAAVRRTGVSDDEIFELVIAAALGQSTRQLDAALEALDVAITCVPKTGGAA